MDNEDTKSGPPPANLPVEPPQKPMPPPPPIPPRPAAGFGRPTPPPPVGGPPRPASPLGRPTEGLGPRPPMPPTPPPIGGRPTPPPLPAGGPPPEITLRTMKSDLEQLKQGKPGGLPITPPEKPLKVPAGLKAEPAPKKKMPKLLLIGGVIIFGVALAAAGYFFIFPMLFPPEAPPPSVPTAPVSPEIPELLPTTPTTKPHQSLLRIPADFQASFSVSSPAALQQTLVSEASKPAGTDVLKEVLLSDAAGQIDFSSALPVLVSEFSQSELAGFFEEDFTTLLYYDADGVWPAYIAKLKTGASLANAKTLMLKLETSDLTKLFLSSPGTPTYFKNGQVQNIITRYLVFSKKGAALNYGWLGNKLIISTSYNGLKRVLGNL